MSSQQQTKIAWLEKQERETMKGLNDQMTIENE